MRCRRFFVLAVLTAAYAGVAGCADSTSPAARAWERATIQAHYTNDSMDHQNLMAASDGLGSVVFTAEGAGSTDQGRTTFAHVPETGE